MTMSEHEKHKAGVGPAGPVRNHSQPLLSPSKKRKHASGGDAPSDAQKALKKQKRKEKKSLKQLAERDDLDDAHSVNKSIGQMDGQMLADRIAQKSKRFEPDLSLVELEDRRLSGI